jgi:hypothetical protein
MSDLGKDLEKLILRAGIDGALTEDAVAQFHALVKQRDALDADNKRLDDANTELAERITSVTEMYNDRQNQLQGWATREQEIKDREEKCTRLEVEKECADKRVTDHQEMVRLIFRNPVTHRQIPTAGFPGTIDQYGTQQGGESSYNHDVTEEDK